MLHDTHLRYALVSLTHFYLVSRSMRPSAERCCRLPDHMAVFLSGHLALSLDRIQTAGVPPVMRLIHRGDTCALTDLYTSI